MPLPTRFDTLSRRNDAMQTLQQTDYRSACVPRTPQHTTRNLQPATCNLQTGSMRPGHMAFPQKVTRRMVTHTRNPAHHAHGSPVMGPRVMVPVLWAPCYGPRVMGFGKHDINKLVYAPHFILSIAGLRFNDGPSGSPCHPCATAGIPLLTPISPCGMIVYADD